MADVAQSLRIPCRLYANIDFDRLLQLLETLHEALKTEGKNEDIKIFSDVLSTEFEPVRGVAFQLDPGLDRGPRKRDEKILYLQEIYELIIDSLNWVLLSQDFAKLRTQILDPEKRKIIEQQMLLMSKLSWSKERRILYLNLENERGEGLLPLLRQAKEFLAEAEQESAPDLRPKALITLPAWLSDSEKLSALSGTRLTVVKTVVEYFLSATEQDVVFLPSDEKSAKTEAYSPVAVRLFLNTWLTKLYGEHSNFPPELRAFLPHTAFSVVKFDIEVVTNEDKQILLGWKNNLFPFIDKFLKQPAPAPTSTGSTQETSVEGGENDLTTNKTPEEIDQLVDKIGAANSDYYQETQRVSAALLPVFFSMYGIEGTLGSLAEFDRADFSTVQNQFQTDLEFVLRFLPPEAYQKLASGDKIGFRMEVIRRLYAKLRTDPVFLASLQKYVKTYLSQAPQKEKEKIIAAIEAADKDFTEKLKASQMLDDKDDWSPVTLSSYLNLENVSKSDFQIFFQHVLKNEAKQVDLEELFVRLGALVADRWDPNIIYSPLSQKSPLSSSQLVLIFGEEFRWLFESQDSKRIGSFLLLSSEYMRAQQQMLAEKHQLDSIFRHSDASNSSPEQTFEQLNTTIKIIRNLGSGGVESLVIARASDATKAKSYADTATGKTIQDLQIQITNERVEKERAFIASLAKEPLQKQVLFLQQLGAIPEEKVSSTTPAEVDDHLNAYLKNYKSYVENTSLYEEQDGAVEDHNVGAAVQPIIIRYISIKLSDSASEDQAIISPLLTTTQVIRQFRLGQKRFDLNAEKKSLADAGLAALGGAVVGSAIPGGQFLPEREKKIIGAATATVGGAVGLGVASIASKIYAFTQTGLGGLFSVAGGFGGGIVGGILGFTTGHFLGIVPGVLTGATTGAAGGGILGLRLEQAASSAAKTTPLAAHAAAKAKAALTAHAANTTNALVQLGKGLFKGILGAYGPYIAATAGIAGVTIYVFQAQLDAAIPPMPTTNNLGSESKYMILQKKVAPGYKFDNPTDLSYTITAKAKPGYTITIKGASDDMKVLYSKDKSGKTDIPGDQYQKFASSLTALVGQTITDQAETTLGTYTIPFGQDASSYADAGIKNTFRLEISVTGNGEVANDSASTTASVCFGKCPQAQAGCWPTSGTIGQLPYGAFDHRGYNEDAYDIGARQGSTIYAPFAGTVCQKSMSGGYGQYADLYVPDGDFTLRFAHMSQYGDGYDSRGCKTVDPGPTGIIGYVGSTGNSTGPHLHYEYLPGHGLRPEYSPGLGNNDNSTLRTLVPDGAVLTTELFDMSEKTGNYYKVTSCYDGGGK